jgi:hypothetical protein
MRALITILFVALSTSALAEQCPSANSDPAAPLNMHALVAPADVVYHDRKPLKFALHNFIEFTTLQDLFAYIDAQAGRWRFPSAAARQEFGNGLLRRGVESRAVSMLDEKPLEVLLTHTRSELAAAIACLPTSLYKGANWQLDRATYADAFEHVRAKWSMSLNGWSNSSSIAGRVLSNWYPIEEGIELYGAQYDSTEHFWQAVKFHPEVTVADLISILDVADDVDWPSWLARLDRDQKTYLANAYAVEFLRANLTPEHRAWFRRQLMEQPQTAKPRDWQQRTPGKMRFTAYQEKVLWGDLADVFHLIVYFDHAVPLNEPKLLDALRARHFDGIYVDGRKLGFISPEFRALMLEIWKVKYLKLARFNQVIRSIPPEIKLSHFLNDGDSPDIPIPVYVGYLNQIRAMAWKQAGAKK